MIDRFSTYYNEVRLHQSLGCVTALERHEGRHTALIAARKEGMARARERRMVANRQGPEPSSWRTRFYGAHSGPFRNELGGRR